jgi:large subunit ribosomal protein L15
MSSKKVSRMRGSHTHGYGEKKKHRGKGSRGGKGLANIFKHKRVWVKKKRPDLLKRNIGFKSLQQRGLKDQIKTINVNELVRILKNADPKKEIKLSDYGYDKLLGSGQINTKLKIRVNSFTERAEEKVLKAGGQIIKDE